MACWPERPGQPSFDLLHPFLAGIARFSGHEASLCALAAALPPVRARSFKLKTHFCEQRRVRLTSFCSRAFLLESGATAGMCRVTDIRMCYARGESLMRAVSTARHTPLVLRLVAGSLARTALPRCGSSVWQWIVCVEVITR